MAIPVPASLLGDERLARLVGEGNERAFNALYSRYHQQLYRYCHSIVRHDADAQDALQSTFTAALSALRRGQRDAPPRPWLYRIAHNESISLLRRRRVADELPETLPDIAQSVEATAEEHTRLALLVSDLQALPERQRGALVMRELSGLSHEELAQALGVSAGAAKQAVFEARQALQEFAEGRAMACEEIQRIVSDGDRRALRGRRVRAHLRDCGRCHAFADAIPERRAALLALSPALPAAAASGLLQQITGAAHHGVGGGGLLAGAGGKSLGVALSAKGVATGLAIVATATVGAVGAVEVATHSGGRAVRAHLLKNASHRSGAGSASAATARSTTAPGSAGGHGTLKTHGPRSTTAGAGSKRGGAASFAHQRSATGTSLNAGGTNPNARGGNPNASRVNPTAAGGTNATAHGGNPNANGGNPNAKGGNPNAGAGKTNAHGSNPNAGGGKTNAHGSNPNAGGRTTNAHGSNPNAGGGTTNAHGSNPNAGAGNTNANGGNSNAGGLTTNAHGSNPNAKGGH
ncbi:MAG TPA: sigma-70 family RNA polymerase sigma factor [Solirubrobacteraceae bacterium]